MLLRAEPWTPASHLACYPLPGCLRVLAPEAPGLGRVITVEALMNWGPVIKAPIDFLLRSSLQLETKVGKEGDKQYGQGVSRRDFSGCISRAWLSPRGGGGVAICHCPIHLEFENGLARQYTSGAQCQCSKGRATVFRRVYPQICLVCLLHLAYFHCELKPVASFMSSAIIKQQRLSVTRNLASDGF